MDVSDLWHPNIWETLVLRAAFAERCILQGVLALGALSRNTVPSRVASGKSTFIPGYQVGYSLDKYGLAIQELNRRLVEISSTGWELAVLGSLVFIAIEAFQGNEDVARMYLRGALAILETSQGTTGYLTLKGKKDIDSALKSLSRLDLQSLRPVDYGNLSPVRFPVLPLCFRNTEGARDSLNSIVGAMNYLFWKGSLMASQAPTQSHSPLEPALLQDHSALSHLPASWLALFTAYTSHSTLDTETAICTPILLIRYETLQISMSAYLNPGQSGYRTHLPRFCSIVNLANQVLEAQRESYPAPVRTQKGANFHVAVVQPLFFVACKWRDSLMRRRAIEAMAKVRGQSFSHAQLLTRVARWVVAVEEEPYCYSAVRGDGLNTAITEEDMLSDIELDVRDAAGVCRITAWRRQKEG